MLIQILEGLLREALFLFKDYPEWQGKTGAYFCFTDGMTGDPFFDPVSIGEVPREKAEIYLAFCQEKARRLASHPSHLASWESRNPDAGQWGGAVRAGDIILSISGLPEMGDEALMLIMAEIYAVIFMGGNSVMRAAASTVVSRSSNPYWEPLLQFLGRWI